MSYAHNHGDDDGVARLSFALLGVGCKPYMGIFDPLIALAYSRTVSGLPSCENLSIEVDCL